MPPLIFRVALACLIGGATAVHAGLIEEGFEVAYDATFKGIPMGVTTRTLQPLDGQRWAFRSAVAPTGLVKLLFDEDISERSEFALVEGEVRPIRYSYRRPERPDKSYVLEFDWEAGKLQVLPQQKVMDLSLGTQDNLSFLIAVMHKLQRGETRFTMTVVGRRRARDHRVEPRGEALLDTPLGKIRTLFLVAQEVGKDTRYELWCAPEYDFLPIKVRQVKEDDGTIELVVRRIDTGAGQTSLRPSAAPAASG